MRYLMIVSAFFAPLAFADILAPSNRCTEPADPYGTDEYSARIYQIEVDDYESCIKHFISEQESEIANHKEAIDAAIADWNAFVDKANRR